MFRAGARVVVVLAVSVLLMGSKIVIEMPDGGAVVSSSGLVMCGPRETCSIESSNHAFAETFTAVAERGYEFVAWADDDEAMCAGSTSADCDEMETDYFEGRQETSADNMFNSTRKLRPIFSMVESSAEGAGQRLTVRSSHRTDYYDVGGESLNEIWRNLHGATNPLGVNPATGRKPAGNASFQVRYTYYPEYTANGSGCTIASGSLEFDFITTLPRWAASSEVDGLLAMRWQRLQAEIIEHEAGHIALYRKLVQALPTLLSSMTNIPCDELGDKVRLAVTQSVDQAREANLAYDRKNERNAYLASLRTGWR